MPYHWSDRQGHVVVVGGINLDFTLRARTPIVAGTSNPGDVRASAGGVARNVAQNLALLGVETVLFGAVGRDVAGDRLLAETAVDGVDVSLVRRVPHPTGAYAAVLRPDGELAMAVADSTAVESLDRDDIEALRPALAVAACVVADCNLSAPALARLAAMATEARVPIAVDAVSAPKSARAGAVLAAGLSIDLLTTDSAELASLAPGHDPFTRMDALLARGARAATTGLGAEGVVVGEVGAPTTRIASLASTVRSVTGAGDAALAGTVAGLLAGCDLRAAARWGQAAAAITLASDETVSDAMSRASVISLGQMERPLPR